jgi:sec-independent protein translocase protein TatB
MFDVGFSEIMVIAVVALIVIGPERLPKAARTLGHLFGRLQRYVNDVKSDINREIELDELRKLQQQVKTAASEFETSMTPPSERSIPRVMTTMLWPTATSTVGMAVLTIDVHSKTPG